MQAVPSTPAPSRTRQHHHHHQHQQQQRRPNLKGTGSYDAYCAPGDRGQTASRPGEDVRQYQDSGASERPRSAHEGNGTSRDGRGGVADAALQSSRDKSPISPWFNKRFHEAREGEASQQHRRGENQGAHQPFYHHKQQEQQPQKQRMPVSHDRQQQQHHHQQHQGPSGPTSHPPTQPSPIPSYARESTFHLLPAPLKIKNKTTKQETSPRAVEGTAEATGGLTRSTTHASRPLQASATHETGAARSNRDQQQEEHHHHSAVASSSPEPRIAGAGWTPKLPLEELMDEVEMLWRRVPN
ncbi:hypothetical protein CSAL01_11731 [Colletotrichum salicis]|uniref:Uncharacterized protein n=1 Tax=Colletotrichum salicis TaxID=1209931 RepID=A0A135THM9_9PEZI|nr:hypothetical protein CSAL01_11731 [Colletotrichum salicis]